MKFNIEKTASHLLKLADAIEKEASEKTYFICDCCNHTANLSSINSVRAKIASESGISSVKKVSVNDEIACPAYGCEGVMSYVATDDSEKFYIDVKSAEDEEDFTNFSPVDER